VPAFGPISRRDLVKNLKNLGFKGPYEGKKHDLMIRGEYRPRIPNPHKGDVSRDLLGRILEQAGVSKEEWRNL
jgi:hypothetical protein